MALRQEKNFTQSLTQRVCVKGVTDPDLYTLKNCFRSNPLKVYAERDSKSELKIAPGNKKMGGDSAYKKIYDYWVDLIFTTESIQAIN
jgi:hypothetical protein